MRWKQKSISVFLSSLFLSYTCTLQPLETIERFTVTWLSHWIVPAGASLQAFCGKKNKFFFFFFFSWLHLWHVEVSRLGAELEPQLPAYATATATPDLSCICNLCCSLWQCQTLNPLSKLGIEPASSRRLRWVLNLLGRNGNFFEKNKFLTYLS